jgi:hypothetical protein
MKLKPFGFTALLVVLFAPPSPASEPIVGKCIPKVCRCNGWLVAETDDFWVCCYNKDLPLGEIASHCESLRHDLSKKWFGDTNPAKWSTKCMVVLHPGSESYLAAAGQEASATAGSSLIERAGNNVVKRRIDLRGDRSDNLTAALPHELTHVLMADHFGEGALPRWAEEGMAVLADTELKQQRHARDLDAALRSGKASALSKLLPQAGYPAADQWAAFYGQSLSVVNFLVQRESPHRFVQFLDAARSIGYDRALKDFYGVRDTEELDRLWLSSTTHSTNKIASNR